jgi:hypothetical protein
MQAVIGQFATLSLVLALAACGGSTGPDTNDPDGNDSNDGTTSPCSAAADPTASLSCDVQPIFSASCALSGCHAGPSPAENLDLGTGAAFGAIVNVPAVQAALMRIRPGQPDSSYLVHKIQGTQASVGGSGVRMPLGRAALSQAQIDTVRAWVSAGAPNN